jgi:SAM-dependent methyltransferase
MKEKRLVLADRQPLDEVILEGLGLAVFQSQRIRDDGPNSVWITECLTSENFESVTIHEEGVYRKTITVAGRLYCRFLDLFYFPCDLDGRLAVAVLDHFANIYESIIEAGNNESNIRVLLEIVVGSFPGYIGNSLEILDFGCGSGLSMGVLAGLDSKLSVHLVGTDLSPRMLLRARERGLEVIEPDSWPLVPNGSFDGVIASYVIHFGLRVEDVAFISRCLKRRGVFAANFFKPSRIILDQLVHLCLENGLLLGRIIPTVRNSILVFRSR